MQICNITHTHINIKYICFLLWFSQCLRAASKSASASLCNPKIKLASPLASNKSGDAKFMVKALPLAWSIKVRALIVDFCFFVDKETLVSNKSLSKIPGAEAKTLLVMLSSI